MQTPTESSAPRPRDLAHAIRIALGLPVFAGALALCVPQLASAGGESSVTVAGTNLGAIPDGPAAQCGTAGTARDVSFSVPYLPGRVLLDLDAETTFNPVHSWGADITATLIAPPAGGFQRVLFGRVGVVTATSCGDSSDLAGPYAFSDAASPPSGGFWEAAANAAGAVPIPSGSYFTTDSGGAGATNPMPPTSLEAAFGGMTSEQIRGNWILRLTDSGGGDTGGIGAAALHLHLLDTRDDPIFRDGLELTVVAASGTNLGPIPDAPASQCGMAGAPRTVEFALPSVPGYTVTNVDVTLSFGPMHTWGGDVTATLRSPGALRQHVLFGRLLATTSTACGSSKDLSGPYRFTDAAVPPYGGIWEAITAGPSSLESGNYFATNSGGAGATNPMPPTVLANTFAGMTAAEFNGTWTLQLTDSGGGDTGAINFARLRVYIEKN